MTDIPSPPDQSTRVSPSSAGTLQIQMPDGKNQQVPLLKASLTVGRAPDNDLVLDHATVSRYHARLELEQGRLYIEDLGSSNGSYIGDLQLAPGQVVEVSPNQVFEFGQVRLGYQPFGAPLPAAAPASAFEKARAAFPPLFNRLNPLTRLLILSAAAVSALGLAIVCVAAGVGALLSRGSAARLTPACNQEPMVRLTQGGFLFAARAVETAFPASPQLVESLPAESTNELEPILTTAFLELPFPYDGGNENFGGTLDQFRLAVQRNVGTGGRLNSFFDHYLPLYPAPSDPSSPGGQEPAEAPIAKNILPYDGILNPYFAYSGHPALDFSTFVYRQPTTPLFAAADGVIAAVGTHGASGALYVKINHTIENVGQYQTIYWHLHPDEFFEAMRGREGENIQAGARLGTMGNTGFSTGHHLHFEVRFDLNGDGNFSGSEAVDPFGWTPSSEFPQDPWYLRAKVVSNYLWMHPLGSSAVIPPDGGGEIAQPGGTGGEFPVSACAQPGALPPDGTVYYAWAPDPEPSPDAAGVGQGCVLSVLDAQGQPVTQFNSPVKIVLPFDQANLSNIDPNTLVIYWKEATGDWYPLETTLDFENEVAIAETDRPGKCSLMGQLTADILPPKTTIQVNGVQSPEGTYYDEVQVTLISTDASEVSEIYYSLDNGNTWLLYSAPLTLLPGPVPEPIVMDEEFFGGPPGSFVILASAIDTHGNIEDPPALAYFAIDPSKNPEATLAPTSTATRTATPTVTRTSSPTSGPSATSTQAACAAVFTLDRNANCRKGPGTVYDVFTSYFAGTELTVDGRSADGTWLWVQVPDTTAHCWMSTAVGSTSSDVACMQVIAAPPTPTPKPVDTTAPPAPTLIRPSNGSNLACNKQVTLNWSAVEDPSGIAEYRWVLEVMDNSETFVPLNSGSTSDTSVTVNLNGCFYYRWSARAVDGAGNIGPLAPYNEFSNSGPG
jgi:murein DD-endopeptidase MepM/ murein hydrolase activator NlpD